MRHPIKQSLCLLALLASMCSLARAQTNYVPNGSFENNTAIPLKISYSTNDRLKTCGTGWRSGSTLTTPDYFHYDNHRTCIMNASSFMDSTVTTSGTTLQNNLFGEETPLTGKAYAGIIIGVNLSTQYNNAPVVKGSEYIVRPISGLTPGKKYSVSFNISFADGSLFAFNNLGALVTDSAGLPASNLILAGFAPQALESSVITQRNGWQSVQGIFTATSSMNCIVIGYFPKTDPNQNIVSSTVGHPLRGAYCYPYDDWGYYYIDDVRIYESTCGCLYPDSAQLVVNGDFSAPCSPGPTAYSSDLTYYDCSNPLSNIHPGITETDSGVKWNLRWQVTDHSPGGGTNVLMVDGPVSSSGDKRAWYQTVNVTAGTRYCFSAWVRNICNGTSGNCTYMPTFQLRVGGLTGTLIDQASNIQYSNGWIKISGIYTATSTGPAEIDIVVKGTGNADPGNDGAIDDITFVSLPPAPDASFTFTEPKCKQPVSFDAAANNIDFEHQWNFSYGTTNLEKDIADPTINFYEGNDNPGTVTVTHIVKNGCGADTVIKHIKMPDCRPCCDTAIRTHLNPSYSHGDSCCSDLVLDYSHCDLYGVIVDGKMAIPLSPYKLQPPVKIGTYCAKAGESKTIDVRFLKLNGDSICRKTIDISCDTAHTTCCNSLQAILVGGTSQEGENCKCKFIIKATQFKFPPLDHPCPVYGVRLVRQGSMAGTLTQNFLIPTPWGINLNGTTVGTLCIPPRDPYSVGPSTLSGTIIVQFLDFNGNVMCSQELSWSCNVGGSGMPGNPAPPQGDDKHALLSLNCQPNPFSKDTKVTYSLPYDGTVNLSVYNLQGQLIEQVEESNKTAGNYSINFSNKAIAAGVYILRLDTPYGSQSIKISVSQ